MQIDTAYDAMSTKLDRVKIDGFFMRKNHPGGIYIKFEYKNPFFLHGTFLEHNQNSVTQVKQK